MLTALSVQPRHTSMAAVHINLTPPANSQSTRNQWRRNRSWSGSLYFMGLMLLFMFLSITVMESAKDCSIPRMSSYVMPGEELSSFNKFEVNLTRNQGIWSIKECYIPQFRDIILFEGHHNSAMQMGR